jgi:hypothetical protein
MRASRYVGCLLATGLLLACNDAPEPAGWELDLRAALLSTPEAIAALPLERRMSLATQMEMAAREQRASSRVSASSESLSVELLLGCGGLMVARALAAPSPVALGMALWGYFLVQSCYFLLAGWGARQPAAGVEDPFDRVRRQILELLGDARGSL